MLKSTFDAVYFFEVDNHTLCYCC